MASDLIAARNVLPDLAAEPLSAEARDYAQAATAANVTASGIAARPKPQRAA